MKERDGEERAKWAKVYRESEGITFGAAVHTVWLLRAMFWDPQTVSRRTRPLPTLTAGPTKMARTKQNKRRKVAPPATLNLNRKTTQPKKQKKAKGKGQGKGSKRATQMRNGEKICTAWNEGRCTVEGLSCPAGKHVCNAYTDKHKRVCAMRNHKGMECSKAVSL